MLPPAPTTDRWLRVFRPRPQARVRLVCFPHAGGAASSFRDLACLLPDTVELLAVQYPGRQDRFGEPPAGDLDVLLGDLTAAVRPLLGRPVALFGHSMGATLAFEVARRLQPRHPSPLLRLFVSARKAPQDCRPLGLGGDDTAVRAFVRKLGGSSVQALEHDELWQLTLPALRGDLGLLDRYAYLPGSPVTCPITAIRGEDDASFTGPDASGWARHTTAGFDSRALPGGHFYTETSASSLAALLVGALAAGTGPRPL